MAATGEDKMSNVFGFSTEPTPASDFLPIIKIDARAGKIFRMDRVAGADGFFNEPVEITQSFKALADFENIETGWIDFAAGSAPSFALVPMGTRIPERPSERHKNGIRFMLKLAKECGGDKPIREVAGTSKAFLSGIEAVYKLYQAGKAANPGKLPVITVTKWTPVKSGSGAQTSTNYHPTFAIVAWAPRGDLAFVPKTAAATTTQSSSSPAGSSPPASPPSTGSTQVKAPMADADSDFG